MAGEQDKHLKDVKTIVECNTSMMESMMGMLQSIQGQNLKIERRVGALETEVYGLRTNMADWDSSNLTNIGNSNEKTQTFSVEPEISKEVLKMYLTEISSEVKTFVKDKVEAIVQGNQMQHDNNKDNMDKLEKKLMSKFDALMTTQGTIHNNTKDNIALLEKKMLSTLDAMMKTQGNTAKKFNQLAKEFQGLKETDSDMSDKLSGLIRCSAHGSIKVHQELVNLNAAADDTAAKLSSEMKTQTKSLKNNQNSVKEVLGSELSVLKDITEHQTETLNSVKDVAEYHTVELASVKDIVQNNLPHKDNVMLKRELKGELEHLKKDTVTLKEELKGELQTQMKGNEKKKSTFLKRVDFSTDGCLFGNSAYVKYVKENVHVGMKVMFCEQRLSKGITKGNIGTVTSFNIQFVWVNWENKTNEFFSFHMVEMMN